MRSFASFALICLICLTRRLIKDSIPLVSTGSLMSADVRTEAMGFHTTHWTVVLAAASAGDGTKMREALASLCETYWYPLYAFIRRQGTSPDDAKDLTQEFFRLF